MHLWLTSVSIFSKLLKPVNKQIISLNGGAKASEYSIYLYINTTTPYTYPLTEKSRYTDFDMKKK